MPLQRLQNLSEIAPHAWDALVPDNQPFLRHAFLSALEDSGSVGPHSGWQPEHLLHIEDDRLVAALPSYRKWHSYGEYVFDHGWADACARAGIDYYPKLLTAVPFSPLVGRGCWPPGRGRFRAAQEPARLPEIEELSSAHINFTDAFTDAAMAEQPGWLQRIGCQYHWQNRGYRDFRTFSTCSLRASANRCARNASKWRGRASSLNGWKDETGEAVGFRLRLLRQYLRGAPANTVSDPDFSVCWPSACPKRFAWCWPNRLRPVAMAFSLVGGDSFYGRYWGCLAEFDRLHFETCFIRAWTTRLPRVISVSMPVLRASTN